MYIKEQTAKVRQYQHEKDPEKALELLDYAEKRVGIALHYGVRRFVFCGFLNSLLIE